MPCLGYEQVAVSTVVKTEADFTIPTGCTHVLIQAAQQAILFTSDGATAPTAGATGVGEMLSAGVAPRQLEVEDFKNIQVIRGAGSDGVLNVHYYGGRAI